MVHLNVASQKLIVEILNSNNLKTMSAIKVQINNRIQSYSKKITGN